MAQFPARLVRSWSEWYAARTNKLRAPRATVPQRDVLIMVVVMGLAFVLAVHYDLFEWLSRWAATYEAWQLDEVLTLLSISTVAVGLFAVRRWFDLQREMTSRQQAEQAYLESKERFRVVVDTSPDAITLTTLGGEIVMTNRQAARMMDFASPEAMIGRNTYDLIAPESRAQAGADAERLLQDGTLYNIEYTLLKADGETCFPAEMTVSLLDGPDGSPTYALAVLRDMTERVQADEAKRRYTLGLEITHQIDRAILAARSPNEIAAAALRHLRPLIGAEMRTNIMVFDWLSETAQVLAVDVPGEAHWSAGTRVPLAYLGSLDELLRGQRVVADDLAATPQTTINNELIHDLDVHGCMLIPLLVDDDLVGLMNVASASAYTFDPIDVEIVQEVAQGLAIAIRQARLAEALTNSHARVRTLSARLLQAQELERQRIARELHDQIGQLLTAVKLNLQALPRSPDGRAQAQRLEESLQLIDATIGRVRDLSLDLRPSLLDDLGLAATLRWYLDREAQRGGLAPRFVADLPDDKLPSEVQVAAFRIAQEAITNVLRHAQARMIMVRVSQADGALELCICDDGVGFDPSLSPPDNAPHGKLGLLSMRERAQLAGGRVHIDSTPGRGTEVYVRLPLSAPPAPLAEIEPQAGIAPPCTGGKECPWERSACCLQTTTPSSAPASAP